MLIALALASTIQCTKPPHHHKSTPQHTQVCLPPVVTALPVTPCTKPEDDIQPEVLPVLTKYVIVTNLVTVTAPGPYVPSMQGFGTWIETQTPVTSIPGPRIPAPEIDPASGVTALTLLAGCLLLLGRRP